MSAIPPAGQEPKPIPPTQFAASPGAVSPELMSRASSAFNLALGGLFIGLCCCGLIGLIMGIMAMNNAGGVLTLAAPGSEAHSKASTARIVAIIAIVLSIANMIGLSFSGLSTMNR